MSQSRIGSATEAMVNMVVGFIVALLTQITIYPFFGIDVPIGSIAVMQVIFMWVSIIRSYAVRRAFNRYGK